MILHVISLVLAVANLILLIVLLRHLTELSITVDRIGMAYRTRQSQIKQQTGITHKNPQVDAHARTTKRDSNDLEVRGARMSRQTKRYKVDSENFNG